MRKLTYIIMVIGAATAFAQSQPTSRGKEFYCMVMQNAGTPEYFKSTSYFRLFLSSDFATSATISITDGSWSKNVTIAPNVVTTVSLPLSVEDNTHEKATNQAIHIVADTNISAYVIYHKLYSTDSYMALPTDALGYDYVAVCYPSSQLDNTELTASEFGIIATQNNTIVTITPHAHTYTNRPAGVPFSVALNAGQTYLVYGDPTDPTNDLTGSAVSATKPIAFLSGHERTEIAHDSGQSRNCLVEQIPPNPTLGTSFLTAPFAPRAYYPVTDYFRIVAIQNGTQIWKNGVLATTINAGNFYEFYSMSAEQIKTNKPVVLAQYSRSETDGFGDYAGNDPNYEWDPAMMVIPPTEQFLNEYTFANTQDPVAFKDNYVNVVIPDTAVASLLLDGKNVVSRFTKIGTSGFSYAQVSVSQGSHHITADAPFGIYIYGAGVADAYANTGGAGFRVLYQGQITVQLPQITAPAGSEVFIPFTIDSSSLLAISGAKHYHAVLRFDRTVLSPLDTANSVIQGNDIVYSFTDTLRDTIGVLLSQSFMPMFGDADTIPLIIDTFTVDGKNVTVTKINGQFILQGICPSTSPELIAYSSVASLEQNSPNPFSQTANIHYTLTEQGTTKLTVLDMLGRTMMTLANGNMQPGNYTATVNAAGLMSGMYYYVLQTPSQVLRRTFAIEK